jgi:uncharacterized protein YjdB
MKRLLFLVSFILSSVVSANTYYVAPTGKDSNPGTISAPWATWKKGFESAQPGDIVYIRGGIYKPADVPGSNYIEITGRIGTRENPICLFAYPSDYASGNFPVLDCSLQKPSESGFNTAIQISSSRYYKLKGLTICNVWQSPLGQKAQGFCFYECSNLTFENCTAHQIGGRGFYVLNYSPTVVDSTFFINCDAYDCADSLSLDGNGLPNYGNGADGFFIQQTDQFPQNYGLIEGCRAWHCSDDQFNLDQSCLTVTRNCWAFNGGYPSLARSEGNGFKIGDPPPHTPDYISRITYNCISADNMGFGYDPNNALGGEWPRAYTYNNLSYNNKVGYLVQNVAEAPIGADMNIYRNNISYLDSDYPFEDVPAMQGNTGYVYTVDHNTWMKKSGSPYWQTNPSYSVSAADFISLDVNELKRPRKSDGSLPDVNFGKLATGSDLIDGGIADVNFTRLGMKYSGSAPDLGAFEYGGIVTNPKPVTSITVTGAGGATAITTNHGTLQLSAAVLPTDASNKTVTWSIANNTGKASISSSGLVTSIANGTVTARATANDGSGVYGTLTITISNQVVPVTGITVTGSGAATTIATDNGTLQLSAAVLPSDATNKTITWSISSGTDKATISSAGLVTAIDNGTVIAKATANDGSGVSGTLTITITNQVILVAGIVVTGAGGVALITATGGTLQLSVNVLPLNATNKAVTWSISSGTDKASISSTGLVTALDYGTAIARATANDGSGVYGTLTITISNQIIAVTNISVIGAGGVTTIAADNGSLQLSVTVLPSNATNKAVSWSITSGTDKASISSTGLVTALDNGIVTIRATANDGSGIYGTLVITLSNQTISVSSVTVTGAGGASTITTENGTLQLNSEILPSNATNKAVTWSITGGLNLASINSVSGLVTALDNGTVTARATASDGSGIYGTFVFTISYIKNSPPVVVVNYRSSSYSGFVNEIDASGSYDANKDNLTFTWTAPGIVPISSTTGSSIKYLGPIVSSSQTVEFTISISDGKTTQSKVIPIEILPYKPELETAEIANIEASSYQAPYYPYNTIDGNIGTLWAAEGDGQWLVVELKHPFSVQHVKLAFQSGQKQESYFDILGSADKTSWEPILTKTASCSFSGDIQVFEFPPSKTGKEFNYIKLVGLGNSTDTWNYISELKIFGYRYKRSPAYENLPVKIYPNPAKDHITVNIEDPTLNPDLIQITTLSGKAVFMEKLNPDIREFTIPLNLQKGFYIIKLALGNLTLFTQKLVVNG